MRHPLAMDDSSSDPSDEEDSGKVIFAPLNKSEAMTSREGRPCRTIRTYSRAKTKGDKMRRGKHLGVALSLQEDEWLESILDVGKEKQEKLQVVKREATLKKGKGTPKRPKKLPLAPVSKSPTEEECSYGWQQSCWRCSRRSCQLRLCSACQVCIDRRIHSRTMPPINFVNLLYTFVEAPSVTPRIL